MIPNTKRREVESSGVTDSSAFDISKNDTAHIMGILRDTLYSDKTMAVLREYSSNAWDSHREAGKPDLPIKVTLPTELNPCLSIRDYGVGLSHEAVMTVYTQYGASTKRESDNSVGMLGIGSKSGFAYSDSFNIVSCYGNMRRTYVALLDESEKGSINLLHEEPCKARDTGVEIKIPIKVEDIREFTAKAQQLFKHFVPRPKINTELPPEVENAAKLPSGLLHESTSYNGSWTAVMGCVPYRVNLSQLTGENAPFGGIGEHVQRLSGVLYCAIGEVQISASREDLKYSTQTKAALIEKLNSIVDEFVQKTLKEIEQTGTSPWDKRLKAQVLTRMGLPVPDRCKELVAVHVPLPVKPIRFSMMRGKVEDDSLTVSTDTRLLIRDDKRSLKGFRLDAYDHLITPRDRFYTRAKNYSWDDIRAELDVMLEVYGLTGIRIEKLSEQEWHAGFKPNVNEEARSKHKVATFVLDRQNNFCHPWSESWAIEKREPTADDVYVLIEKFKVPDFAFYEMYREDFAFAEAFGVTMPKVYGYKKTGKGAVDPAKLLGTSYDTWRHKLIELVLTKESEKHLEQFRWCMSDSEVSYNYNYSYDPADMSHTRKDFNKVSKRLGEKHIITKLLEQQQTSSRYVKALPIKTRRQLPELDKRLKEANLATVAGWINAPQDAINNIFKVYPLLGLRSVGLGAVWNDDAATWIDYVKMIDQLNKAKETP